jgi:hypothetical protein
VLDKEVDLFYHKDCDLPSISNQKEYKIATVIIEDHNNKQYEIDVYVVEGKVFSLESNLPFRKLLVSDIKTISVQCHTTLK